MTLVYRIRHFFAYITVYQQLAVKLLFFQITLSQEAISRDSFLEEKQRIQFTKQVLLAAPCTSISTLRSRFFCFCPLIS